uniref:Nascent polypeptide-associated complex subunit alpha-like UBA domain-containing protein n=1 Tax=Aplanochytrium stocchinoi TaxID=215587 RepID=A0A7S3PQB2_9STRA|mmetsp:Transcript_4987/g.6296  ORF Transcript_4987/g.6296 Transcript_4987/m.6296 type:complete len:102 (+) Transcript_4987:317-622(+)|eukprot:CAMPEP_0204844210 /NCGR_PEP_ID=MMETSP1347-20130617/61_1 /ASSEMBLY_ACC=CAM_ASM_000690 /TAXON_ID=215587 /ORGANISM="Aplanochytrium stocchinoi, Strain GSBS06" /LENGTH=101 /DNA_ID=CAMNT_0051983509 /DNA_START=205 /DNA_END=510 /DNA_ORIENTATION=+
MADDQKDLDTVNDVVEEAVMDAETAKMAQEKSKAAMAELEKTEKLEKLAEIKRNVELANVEIKNDDVELLMNEMLVSKEKAELLLRQQNGDVEKALYELIG